MRDADRVIGLLEANDIKAVRLVINRLRPAMVAAEQMMSVKDVRGHFVYSAAGSHSR